MKTDRFFEEHPVFRYEEFAAYMSSLGTTRPESWRQQLKYHQKSGNIIHIRKFLYAVRTAHSQGKWIDPYLITSKATADSILAYHTALELHGVAYTTFNELLFLSCKQSPSFSFESQQFRSVLQPKALITKQKTDYQVQVISRGGMNIKVTTLERTIVDVLDRPNLGGGWEEIWRSFDNITQLNIDNMIEYVQLLENATTAAKLGFFLDQRPEYFAASKKQLEKLQRYIPKQTHYMSNEDRHGGKYIEKWRLIVPLFIINRGWEEPNVENI